MSPSELNGLDVIGDEDEVEKLFSFALNVVLVALAAEQHGDTGALITVKANEIPPATLSSQRSRKPPLVTSVDSHGGKTSSWRCATIVESLVTSLIP